MLQNIRQISILNKIFNVRGNEWPKISIAWVITFLYRVGFVTGWTVLIALFVSNYGISSLPYLFIINAVFSILGSLFYSTFLDRISKDYLIVITIFLTTLILSFAYYFSSYNAILFFALLIVAESLFLGQLRIILHGYTEELFTPIQSERTFPLIESSETVGGVVAGLIITFTSISIDPNNFILIWIGALLLMIPFVFVHKYLNKKVRKIAKEKKTSHSDDFFSRIRKELKNTTHMSYIKGVFLIVFFQWFLFNLLEFQYTKAVYQNVSEVILEGGSGFEHAFVHDLGQLFILFSGSALIIQLFVGSRLINSLGVVGSMLLHPIVTLFSVLGLTSSFTFNNAVFTKNNFTITSVIHMNAYHSSYYAIKDSLREHIREFLDGIIRPIGAIFGTLVLILLQRLFIGEGLILYVNISMIIVCFILLYVTYAQQNKYTQVALEDLQKSKNKQERFNAIDILSQKGHKYPLSILTYTLKNNDEPVSIRVKILRALAEIQDISAVEEILHCLKSNHEPIRNAAIEALLSYKVLYKDSKRYLIVEHKLIDNLEKAYKKEKNDDIRSKILMMLSSVSTVATFDFLLHALRSSKGVIKANIINALGNFKDPSIVDVIKPFLRAKDRLQRRAAIVALGHFKETEEESKEMVKALLSNDKSHDIVDVLFIIGELRFKEFKHICLLRLNSNNKEVKLHAAIALLKMDYGVSIPVVIDMLFYETKVLRIETKSLLENVDVRIYKNIDRIIKHLVMEEIEKIIPEDVNITYNNLKKKDLKTLKWLYSLIEEYDEIHTINQYLNT